jgi:uncharacterized protein YndB with AHSA1/START domain
MRTFSKTVTIDTSADYVWELITDYKKMPKWFKGARKVTSPDAPRTGVGTRRHVSPGGPLVMEEVITHWEDAKLFGYSVRKGIPGLKKHQGLIKLTPLGKQRCEVTYETSLEMALPIPLDPVGYVGGKLMNEVIGGALKELKKLAER